MAAGVELDILSTEKLNVTLVSERLWVGRILPPELHGCAWPLLKCLMSSTANSGERAGFFSFTQDEDELTLMMDDWCHHVFASSASASAITYMPRRWRAFEFRLGALAWEVPGVMSFLSTLMSESQISILKVASYDRDFLLVQETDVAGASRLIQERLHLDVDCLKEAMQEKLATRRMGLAAGEGEEGEEGSFSQSRRAEAPDSEYGDGASSTDGRGGRAGSSRAAEESESDVAAGASDGAHPWSTDDSDGLYVKVLPTNLVVVRLQLAMLSLSTHALIQRLLFSSSRGRRCFWSYTHVEDEVSLIVDDLTLQDFPEEALVGGTSTRWRPLMLAGRSFAFNETGVVSAMFAPYEDGVPLLNISTFSTNVTLVEDSDIERALSAFKLPHKVLECEESDGED
ncbi:hypothetical protein AB1Y20_017977 [Prymnesium parvum]|uniref:CASTOR ACT domain-containing protein n=1 Tax=Prymnesium parvum TaxID=97485 RepID=A0AB34JPY0_PRYPA